MPSDQERPDEVRVPFIFVPLGHPEPKEWMARHPGWVKFPAVMVPRAAPDPQPAWPPAPMPASLPLQGPVAGAAAAPEQRPTPAPPIDGMTAEATERYNRYIGSVISPGARPAGQAAVVSEEVAAALAPHDATAPTPASGVDPRWVKTADENLRNPAANAYDDVIGQEVEEYKKRFAGIPGVESLDRRLFKAQLLTETGPADPQWGTLPAQIGKKADPGYRVLKEHLDHSDLIMSPSLQQEIATKPITDPTLNVRAAIAYALTLAMHSHLVSRRDPTDTKTYQHIVRPHESLGTIARAEHTTVTELQTDNPCAALGIKPGQMLTFHRASLVREIYAFDPIGVQLLAEHYNVGDKHYAEKMQYLLGKLQ